MITAEGTKFKYSFQNDQGEVIGNLVLPTGIAMPKNVSTKSFVPSVLQDNVKIFLGKGEFIVDYEIVGREKLVNDLRFNLTRDGKTLGSALVKKTKRPVFKWPPYDWPPIEIEFGNQYILTGNGFFSFNFSLQKNGQEIGRLSEKPGFTIFKKRFLIELPSELSEVSQLFIFFLAVNRAYR